MDPVIAQAAETCGLAANLIHSVSSQQILFDYNYKWGKIMSITKLQRFKVYFLYF